jgi:uncharacterized phage-associated protein
MEKVDDVAAALLIRTGPITTMKLQKLVFYCQAWHLAITGEPLFAEPVEAWVQGPVVRALHARHKGAYEVRSWPAGNSRALSEDSVRTIEWVVQKYGAYSAETLSAMTHQEIPWIVARGDLADGQRGFAEISQAQMYAFYSRQRAEPEVAVTQAAASAALEGQVLDDVWQEAMRSVATGMVPADEVIAKEIERIQRA